VSALLTEAGDAILVEDGGLLLSEYEGDLMAKALRVDDVRQDPDGKFTIEYSYGDTPLPVGSMRFGIRVNSPQDIKDELDEVDSREATRILFLLIMARFRQVDPDMDTPALIEGRVITFDPTSNNIVTIV
jgi:hypothetical protein